MKTFLSVLLLTLIFVSACKGPKNKSDSWPDEIKQEVIEYNNPPAEGFDAENSHAVAILLADQVMRAMGGRETWDRSNVFHWNFFGKRKLLWDKPNQMVRVDEADLVTILDMKTGLGSAWKAGVEIADSLMLNDLLVSAKKKWINDSYWLFMPFKLKDSGVTLTYFNSEPSQNGEPCDVIGLTFSEVGVTPNNAYRVWVSIEDKLVKQWAYYQNFEDEEPKFILPWDDYQEYNGLLLASDRGERDITEIKVLKKAEASWFDSPEPIQIK